MHRGFAHASRTPGYSWDNRSAVLLHEIAPDQFPTSPYKSLGNFALCAVVHCDLAQHMNIPRKKS